MQDDPERVRPVALRERDLRDAVTSDRRDLAEQYGIAPDRLAAVLASSILQEKPPTHDVELMINPERRGISGISTLIHRRYIGISTGKHWLNSRGL